ncbi:MAG: hypothetical protein AABY83_04155 [Pseudomonadota bacterium]
MRIKAILLLMLASVAAHAGVLESPVKAVEKMTKNSPASQLRCWQYGTLIFEETQLIAKQLPSGDKDVVFLKKDGSQEKLHLFNMDGAACMYREAE